MPNSNLNIVHQINRDYLKKNIETIHMDNAYRLYKLIWLYKCIGVINWVKTFGGDVPNEKLGTSPCS